MYVFVWPIMLFAELICPASALQGYQLVVELQFKNRDDLEAFKPIWAELAQYVAKYEPQTLVLILLMLLAPTLSSVTTLPAFLCQPQLESTGEQFVLPSGLPSGGAYKAVLIHVHTVTECACRPMSLLSQRSVRTSSSFSKGMPWKIRR